MNKKTAIIIFFVTAIFTSCNKIVSTDSKLSLAHGQKIVNIPHTKVKKQTIGNCWIYSTIAMIESIILKTSNKHENFSESYLTYWDFYDKLLPTSSVTPKEVIDAGNFPKARLLIRKYGLMRDKDFIPEEANTQGSEVQANSLKAVNESLKNGALAALYGYKLSRQERKALVKGELDRIFNLKMDEKLKHVIKSQELMVVSAKSNELVPLDSELYNWISFPFSNVFSGKLNINELDYNKQIELDDNQKKLLKRVKENLNKGFPAMISWFLDTNALENGEFSIKNIQKNGIGSNQGGHITVLEDYTASGVDPITGKEFHLGEGETTIELKKLALEHGKIDYFVIKNSWGDDPEKTKSYKKDGEYGYHKLNLDYLLTWLEVKANNSTILPILSIVLPKE
jgi:hypothetical protein